MITSTYPMKSLEEVIDRFIDYRGRTPAKTESGIPLVTAKLIKGGQILEPTEFIATDDYDKWMTRGFPEVGDVVLTTEAPLGEVAQISDAGIALAQRVLVMQPKKELLNNAYLKRVLTTPIVVEQINRRSTGSTVRGIRQKELRKVEIPLPTLSEQKRIADILDKADAIRRKRQKAIGQFGTLTESLFNEMFSHKLSSLRWIDLSDYLVELRYGTSNKSGEGGYTTLRIPNIVRGIIDLTDIKTVEASGNELEKLKLVEGDVLFVRTNGNPDYVGRCAVFEPSQMEAAGLEAEQIIYASYLIRARLQLDRIRPLFLQSFLQTPAGRRNVREKCRTSAGQYNINTKGIGALQIPDVALEEQVTFETRVRSFSPALTSLTTAHSEADNLFNSLVQRAFKGDL